MSIIKVEKTGDCSDCEICIQDAIREKKRKLAGGWKRAKKTRQWIPPKKERRRSIK